MPVSKGPKGVAQEMHKFKAKQLHSGSATGPIVTNPKQALAISLNEAGMSKKPKTRPRKKFTSAKQVDDYAAKPGRTVRV